MQNPIQKFENFDELQLPYISLLFADFIIILILITTRVKTFSPSYIHYVASERLQGGEQFHSKEIGNASFPCQNVIENCNPKTELCKGKSYIKKLYTRL